MMYQSVKQFGSSSGLSFVNPDVGLKVLTVCNVITHQQMTKVTTSKKRVKLVLKENVILWKNYILNAKSC